MNDDYICPFCAFRGKLKDFTRKLKTGYSRKRCTCPDCDENMMRTTLKRNITPYEWGAWLYASIRIWNRPHYRFYDRISWEKLKIRVKRLNIANEFWSGFKDTKELNSEAWNKIVDNAYIPQVTQLKLAPIKRMLKR